MTTKTATVDAGSAALEREALQKRLDAAVKEREWQEAKVNVAHDDIEKARGEVDRLEAELRTVIAELDTAKLIEKLIEDVMASRGDR
jgi:hypothetical protein